MVMKLLPDSFRKDNLKSTKPSKRIPLRIRFKVSGKDENGFVFEEYAESVDVSAGGGCLVFMKDIKKGESLKLYSPKGGLFLVSVRWFRYDMRKNVRYFGFQLAKPGNPWVLTNGETGSSRPKSRHVTQIVTPRSYYVDSPWIVDPSLCFSHASQLGKRPGQFVLP